MLFEPFLFFNLLTATIAFIFVLHETEFRERKIITTEMSQFFDRKMLLGYSLNLMNRIAWTIEF